MKAHETDVAGKNNETGLGLLTTNYQNLHSAYWKCHQFYWTMTSIFLPITLTAFAFVIKDVPREQAVLLVLLWLVALALLTYWWQTARYLHAWNRTRKEQLIRLEELLNRAPCLRDISDSGKICFSQYRLKYPKGFHDWTRWLYGALVILTFVILLVKLFVTS